MAVSKEEKEPQLIFTQTQSGWFCEYKGKIDGIKGMGGFGQSSEEAQINLFQLLKKQRELMNSLQPSILKASPKDIPIDPMYQEQFRALKET